jgi:cyclic beta-1,2-glucan synthetase
MAYEELVKPSEGLALLFTPPFESSTRDPGYIKAYPPGVRENGGQYTHGAIWSIFAHAALGQASEAAQLFSMINPINHALTAQAVETYRVEPYVIAADVYSIAPHCGRGGWTWYTGSAGWFYRAGLEAILGITRQGDELIVCPCLPPSWAEAEVTLPSFAGRCIIRITRQPLSSGTLDAAVQQVGANQYVINLSRLQKDAVLTLSLSESP